MKFELFSLSQTLSRILFRVNDLIIYNLHNIFTPFIYY